MNRMIYDEKNMCFRSMTDNEVILSRIKEGKGLEPLQTLKNKGRENMRAIDADTLKKTLRDWIRDYWTDAFTGDDAGSEFADMIDHAETIESSKRNHIMTMDVLERAKILLTATKDLLEKQENSGYILNLLRETVFYDGAECDGSCLKDDIDYWFEELDQAKNEIY